MAPRCRRLSLLATLVPGIVAQQPTPPLANLPEPIAMHSPAVTAEGEALVAVWADSRQCSDTLYCSRSLDGGVTWRTATSPLRCRTQPLDPTICLDHGVIHVAWRGALGCGHSRSTDMGTTWSPPTFLGDRSANMGPPAIAANDGLVCLGHIVSTPRGDRVMVQCSRDGGTTWQPPHRVDGEPLRTAPVVAHGLRVAVDDTDVHAVWIDNRGEAFVYAVTSHDSGATWPLRPMALDDDMLPGSPNGIVLHARHGTIHVAWVRTWTSQFQVLAEGRYQRSLDHGATWMDADQGIENAPLPPRLTALAMTDDGPRFTLGANLPADQPADLAWLGSLLTAMSDRRAVARSADSLLFTAIPYGTANSGSDGRVPHLDVVAAPRVGADLQMRCDNALGSTPMVLVGNGRAEQAIGAPSPLGDTPTHVEFALTNDGAAELRWHVPADAALVGASLHLQAFFVDSAANGSLSHTTAREVSLL